jgi:hypothetical protein
MITKFAFGVLTCLSLVACGETTLCDRNAIFTAENKTLTNGYDNLSGNYYQISIFNGYMRVPNRYFLSNKGMGGGKKVLS